MARTKPTDPSKAAITDALMNCIERVAAGNWVGVSLDTLISGEDETNYLLKVEQRYSYSRKTADGQVKAGPGFVHTVTFSATGAVTAGAIALYDSLTGAGTLIWTGIIQAGLNPVTITLDCEFATGLYVAYDGTIANVATTVSFR